MPSVDCVVETEISRSVRARQVEALFDVPPGEKSRLAWKGDVPIDDEPWNVGMIVGPSGSGKTTVARALFGDDYHPEMSWGAPSVIDDCDSSLDVAKVAEAFGAVGFNTIPAWLRPFHVLSNGEKFRVELARRLLELSDPIVVDEFTSVVDRQVAQIGSHAVQKLVRRAGRRFVAVSCHYDIEDWLQPDWILEPSTMLFRRRHLQRRPLVDVEIRRERREDSWPTFAPFHYLSAELATSASCMILRIGGRPAAFCGVMSFPHPKVRDIRRVSRLVTLPDWQGLGLAFVLVDAVASMWADIGFRLRTYPAHPALVRSFGRSTVWRMIKRPGVFSPKQGDTATIGSIGSKGFGGRPCAVFEYVGPSRGTPEESMAVLGVDREGKTTTLGGLESGTGA